MKKNKVKGFTLIECIVAIALIGIASLMMAQVYSSVALLNKENLRINNSLERQMQYAELELTKATTADSGTVKVTELNSYTGKNSGGDTVTKKIEPVEFKLSSSLTQGKNSSKFKVGVKTTVKADIDLYVIGISVDSDTVTENQNNQNKTVTRNYDGSVRYKFLLPKDR
jgi:prepilin-type N-terminal cleavage/methylation domain-containing protein